MNKHLGSNFDNFLEEEGVLAHAEAVAVKRVLSYQFQQTMKKKQMTKSRMASIMRTSRAALDRVLDPENSSVTLHTLERAAQSVGKKLRVELV